MRWALCGVLFALAVGLAIGTAAIRAQNVLDRRLLEDDYRQLEMRAVELRRQYLQTIHFLCLRSEVAAGPETLLGLGRILACLIEGAALAEDHGPGKHRHHQQQQHDHLDNNTGTENQAEKRKISVHSTTPYE